MARARKNIDKEKCVHCFKIPDEITDDHVIPKSWYSEEQSKTVYKPVAPACLECNQNLGKNEQLISHLMWLCMPETNPLVPELRQKVYRACGIGSNGKPIPNLKEKDRVHRNNHLKKLISTTRSAKDLDESMIMPGFGFHKGYSKDQQRYTNLDKKLVTELAAKVVRGLEYRHGGRKRYIEPPYQLEIYFPTNPNEASLQKIRDISPVFSDGTNLIQRGAVPERPLEPIYVIRLWNHWEIWGVILHEDESKKIDGMLES